MITTEVEKTDVIREIELLLDYTVKQNHKYLILSCLLLEDTKILPSTL